MDPGLRRDDELGESRMTLFPKTDELLDLPNGADWLNAVRSGGAARYAALGMPTPRLESWKYTDLRPFHGITPAVVDAEPVPAPLVAGGIRLVFVDGALDSGLSSGTVPSGVFAGSIHAGNAKAMLARVAPQEQAVEALNTALFSDGLALFVPAGVTLEPPVEVCFTGMARSHVRLLVILSDNAAATLIERHEGTGSSTVVSEIELGSGARLRHYRLQDAGNAAVLLATGGVKLAKGSLYDGFSLTTGGRLSRHQVKAELTGPGAEVRLNGAHVLAGNAHADTTTEIVHAAPQCRSRETYRHVMDGTSRSVFQGKIYVAEGAQKTDGFQLNQSLMLSPTAEVNAKPELEIYADDVKCSHGATSGRLDADALFYLRSRGLPEALARQMLIEAFIGSSIDLIEDEAVRSAFRQHASRVLDTPEEVDS